MKILILSSSSDLYGGSKIMSIVAETLSEHGHHPIVVLSEKGPLVNYLKEKNIEVRIIRLGILRRKYFTPAGLINRIKVSNEAWKKLKTIVESENIDVIYSNTTSVLIGSYLAYKMKVRHVWHIHEIITKPVWFSKTIGYLLKTYGDQVIVVSEAVKKHWSVYVDNLPLIRIYNGIDNHPYLIDNSTIRSELSISKSTPIIGMIGRVNHWKGQNYFMDILTEVNKKYPNCHYIFVGDAFQGNENLEEKLNKSITYSGIKDQIHNLGYRSDIANILAGLDIFISPSTSPDPFPTVILEAMASAKPVFATEHGGAKEMIINHETGVLIPLNDAKQSATMIIDYLNHPDKLKRLGQNARIRFNENFSLKKFSSSIIQFFNSLA